jgi:hypothetical protein
MHWERMQRDIRCLQDIKCGVSDIGQEQKLGGKGMLRAGVKVWLE